jgi:hypothetical protein
MQGTRDFVSESGLLDRQVTRMDTKWGTLRTIEASLQKEITASQVSELEAGLDGVDRAIHLLSVPVRHSDLFFL